MEEPTIHLSEPSLGPEEVAAVREVLAMGRLRADGPISRRLSAEMASALGAECVLLTPSATQAIELGLMCLGVQAGDDVVLPSFTFVSVANAVLRQGARPVFADISDETLDLDPEDLDARRTAKTRVALPSHYAGVGAPMERYRDVCAPHGIALLEDAAQGLGARRNGRWLGTLGDVGAFSFHETKNLTCGEGGAFVTCDPELARKAEIIRQNGTNRDQFLRGEVDRYTWVGEGAHFGLSEILAAVLRVQWKRMEELHRARGRAVAAYRAGLADLESAGKLRMPKVPDGCESNWHIFHLRLDSEERRDAMLKRLGERGVRAAFHYIPLHSSPFGRERLGYAPGDLPVTEAASRTLLRLPLHAGLTDDMIARTIEAVREASGA